MRDPKFFPPIKPEHAAAIGYVAAHWSMVEQQLAFMIYEMLHLNTILGWAARHVVRRKEHQIHYLADGKAWERS
jgi:hypothetical protein